MLKSRLKMDRVTGNSERLCRETSSTTQKPNQRASPTCCWHKEYKPPHHDLQSPARQGCAQACMEPSCPVHLSQPQRPCSINPRPPFPLTSKSALSIPSTWNALGHVPSHRSRFYLKCLRKVFPECSGVAFRERPTRQYSPLPPITSLPVTSHHSLHSAHCFPKLVICSPTYFLPPPQVHPTNTVPVSCSPIYS